MEQLIANLIGDFILQTDKQATTKKHLISQAMLHALTYTIPFIFITQDIKALTVIFATHALIDHYYVMEFIRGVINKSDTVDGFSGDRPIWLTVWLNIIGENTLHLLINFLAIKYL